MEGLRFARAKPENKKGKKNFFSLSYGSFPRRNIPIEFSAFSSASDLAENFFQRGSVSLPDTCFNPFRISFWKSFGGHVPWSAVERTALKRSRSLKEFFKRKTYQMVFGGE